MATTQDWTQSISLHQTFLRFSTHNARTRPHRSKIQRKAYILKCPDELLITIFELAISNPRLLSKPYCDCESPYDYAGIKSLLFTCHHFSRIALPFLYRIIRFDYPHWTVPPTKAAKSLHRSLQENLSLLQHCRVLSIDTKTYVSGATPEDFSVANDFVSWFNGVRCLKIYGGYAPGCNGHILACIQTAVQHMHEIEHISMSGCCLDLRSIMQNVDVPTLRRLSIAGFSDASRRSVEVQPKVVLHIISQIECFMSLKMRKKSKGFQYLFFSSKRP